MATATIIPLKIGVDFGGVLSIHDKNRTFDEGEHNSTKIDMPDAISSLIKLKEFGHKLYLISFCGRRRAIETHEGISQTTSINELFDGIYFVRRISYKVTVCRALGCDLMIDDTLKILKNIYSQVPTMKLIWFTMNSSSKTKPSVTNRTHQSFDVTEVDSWSDIIKTIDEILIHDLIRHEADSNVLLYDKLHCI